MAEEERLGKAGLGVLFVVLIISAADAFMRYGTSPLTNYWVWVLAAFFHTILLIWLANTIPEFKEKGVRGLWWVAVVAYLWGPLWAFVPEWIPAIEYLAGLMMVIAPFWVLVLFFSTGQYPKLSMIYMFFWIFLIMFSFWPQVQDFAAEQGIKGLNPGMALAYTWEKTKEAWQNLTKAYERGAKAVASEWKRSLAMAKGDYYAGRVDEAAQRKLGVFLERMRSEQPSFEFGRPAVVFATMRAETLEQPLFITIDCFAEKGEKTYPASKILPQSEFEVFAFDQRDIDCVFDPNTLPPGTYKAKMVATFSFGTRAYIRSYFMREDRLREFRQQNINPLEGVGEKRPSAVYTSGPVSISMGVGTQPVGLDAGKRLPVWSVAVENRWEGNVLEITNLFFFTPKGISLDEISGVPVRKVSCADLPTPEERLACDDALVNVHTLPAKELARDKYRNQTTILFRAYTSVSNLDEALGQAPVAVRNFKVSANYVYQIERSTSFSVKVREE